MSVWLHKAVIYHIYPLGFCGAPMLNAEGVVVNRIHKVIDWIPHLKEIGVNTVYFGPVFQSTVHGYDTSDYRVIDRRLGSNEDFAEVCRALHENGMRIVLDGVFNHVGRDFFAFKDLQQNEMSSKYCGWFSGLNFGGTSPYGDQFYYDGWNGHYNLVKLNLKNEDAVNYLLDSVKLWVEQFDIDGLRLDAADCVDLDFFARLRSCTKALKPDFWLMGEIIHGDYRRWANESTLDSVTNYECHKGIYSSHNDSNYFEIAHSLNRQFGKGGIYENLILYSFVDNHDVNRLTSMLSNKAHAKNCYTIMYAMPGIPSIYYGSEWGVEGMRDKSSDSALRPCLNLDNIPNPDFGLLDHIKRLGEIYPEMPALQAGDYENIIIRNQQLVFRRSCVAQTVYCVLNLADSNAEVSFRINAEGVIDKLDSDREYLTSNGDLCLNVPPYSSMLLVEEKAAQVRPKTEKNGVVIGARYRHFKGGEYVVTAVAKHSETLEDMVVYQEIHGEQNSWVRPLGMFTENVNDNGNEKPRFEKID